MNAELRLPVPLPVAAAVVLAALAASVFLFVLRAGGGETETASSPATASLDGTPSVDRKAATAPGVPRPLARAFDRHRVVVVALILPDVTVDREAAAEARAGAQMAGAGFVSLSARSPEAAEVAKKLGFTMTPGVAVVGRDLNPLLRIDGFADRESVVQAAVSARR